MKTNNTIVLTLLLILLIITLVEWYDVADEFYRESEREADQGIASSQNYHRNLKQTSTRVMCVKTASNITDSIYTTFKYSPLKYQILKYLKREVTQGSCSNVDNCKSLCNHKGCYDDYKIDPERNTCQCTLICKCVPCAYPAECVNDECKCPEGFDGDPYRDCWKPS